MNIKVNHLSKLYRKKKALEDVSFELNEPKIYGLLGRNGAGKTTFMDILAGHQLPTSGEILINNEHSFDNRSILKYICLIKEGNNFNRDLKMKDVLHSYALFYPNWNQKLAEELVKVYQLPVKQRIKTFSKGMESALGVIVGLASQADITIFDEPYIGLDAAARKTFYNLLLEQYERSPRTIIFSTHLIDEVSLLFEEILILREGKLILHEKADTLRDKAFSVTGPVEEVKAFIQDKHVMKTKQLAHMMTAYIFGSREGIEQTDLTAEGVPIQELMIYLTEKGGEGKWLDSSKDQFIIS